MWNVVCPMSTLGERIKQARSGISQDAFSRELGISKGSLGFYERNENLPNAEVILKICSTTDVRPEWLLTGRGPMHSGDADGAGEASGEAVAESGRASCARCEKMENRLDRLEEERRELSAENRRLWKENAELRERCARFEEREKQEGVLPFFDNQESSRSCKGTDNR